MAEREGGVAIKESLLYEAADGEYHLAVSLTDNMIVINDLNIAATEALELAAWLTAAATILVMRREALIRGLDPNSNINRATELPGKDEQ
jgi:hypothetical protein